MIKSFNNLRHYEKHLLKAMAFSIPISIGLTQIFFFSFIVLGLSSFSKAIESKAFRPLRSQLVCWFAAMVVASCASVDFSRSIDEAIKGLSYPLFAMLVVFYLESVGNSKERIGEIYQILLFLIVGQAIASLATVLTLAIGSDATLGLPGAVTESGQLALVIPVIFGVMLGAKSQKVISNQQRIAGLIFLAIILLVSSTQLHFHFAPYLQALALLVIIVCLRKLYFFSYLNKFWEASYAQMSFLALSLAPFLMAAFIFNLKRGPWLGVLLTTAFLGFLLGRRRVIFGVVIACFSMLLLAPVRTRLLNLVADFTIAGGRERMWELGLEIASRFPLGVGPKNAVYMRVLDPYLPPGHRHLHNNLLNVVVEMGYIGGVIFIWWMSTLVILGFKWSKLATSSKDLLVGRAALLAVSLSGAIFSWQCAGMVEFNFGDAEIKMISFLLMGLLLSLNYFLDQSSKFSSAEIE